MVFGESVDDLVVDETVVFGESVEDLIVDETVVIGKSVEVVISLVEINFLVHFGLYKRSFFQVSISFGPLFSNCHRAHKGLLSQH